MDSNITREQIEQLKLAVASAEPYPIEELDEHSFYDDKDTERLKRCLATKAKIILLENGIEI